MQDSSWPQLFWEQSFVRFLNRVRIVDYIQDSVAFLTNMSHKLTQNIEALRDKKKSFTVKIMPNKVKED